MDGSQPNGYRIEEEYVHLDGWRPVAVARPDGVVGMSNPKIFPVLTDHLGTPRKILDGDTGLVRWSWDAKQPFGHELPNETPAGQESFTFDLRFPGQRYDDETGLFQNGFRDYHPGLGRYVQSDPLGLNAGWNTYSYVGANPLNGFDPDGLVRRNPDGSLYFVESGKSMRFSHSTGRSAKMTPGFIYTDLGNPVRVYKYSSGHEGFKQNCHGYSLNLDIWVEDPKPILRDEYETTNWFFSDLQFYFNNETGDSHSAKTFFPLPNSGKNGSGPVTRMDSRDHGKYQGQDYNSAYYRKKK